MMDLNHEVVRKLMEQWEKTSRGPWDSRVLVKVSMGEFLSNDAEWICLVHAYTPRLLKDINELLTENMRLKRELAATNNSIEEDSQTPKRRRKRNTDDDKSGSGRGPGSEEIASSVSSSGDG
jgi:hypothetical protein